MLVRQVSDGGRPGSEGVTDRAYHTLRYAYLPHASNAAAAQPWHAATAFNQPLIPVWRAGDKVRIQLPFMPQVPRSVAVDSQVRAFPQTFSLISADSGIIADLYRRNCRIEAVILNADLTATVMLSSGGKQMTVSPAPLTIVPVEVASP